MCCFVEIGQKWELKNWELKNWELKKWDVSVNAVSGAALARVVPEKEIGALSLNLLLGVIGRALRRQAPGQTNIMYVLPRLGYVHRDPLVGRRQILGCQSSSSASGHK